MTGDHAEIAEYLRTLLEHESRCEVEDCPSCETLRGICEMIRGRLFSSPIYPDVKTSAASSGRNG